jgi:hypothetical protein
MRILAIDWDRREARAILLSSGPTGMAVQGAWAVPLTRVEGAALSGREIGDRLSAAMAGRLTGKVTTIVGVGRDNVQVQLLSLPPAPQDELAELVRFQAEREFTALGSQAALDFIPITGDAQAPHQVLAVALNPAGLNEARELSSALGGAPDRIPLRACAAASLVHRAGAVAGDTVALIVNPLADEADLIVQVGEKIVLMRTVRLPEPTQDDARGRALVGEIRRTMAAVRQQLADQKVDLVVLCANRSADGENSGLAEELDVPVMIFDPAAHAPASLLKHGVPTDSLARFAAVLGMALGEADRRLPVVDFANVRRRADVRRFTRAHALAAAAAAAAMLWVAAYLWQQSATPARELAALEARIQELQAQADMYKDVTAQASAVERWLATDVTWLDELEQFARRVRPEPLSAMQFPADSDVVVTQVTMLRPPGTGAVGGRIDLQAKAKSDAAVRDLEQRLRQDSHRVTPGGVQQDNTVPGYPRALDLQIHIPPFNPDTFSRDAEPSPPGAAERAAQPPPSPEQKTPPTEPAP